MRQFAKAVVSALTVSLVIGTQSWAMDMVPDTKALKWGAAPSILPKGAEMVVLSGDPTKDGPYVLRLKMPANYVIPAHHHPTTENVTVLSGTLYAGMGDSLDKTKATAFEPGGFASLPSNMNHFAWAATDTVIQVHGVGPFAFTYADPANDPSKSH
jgi:quercetin dioxygenase-like cupin family protein